MKPGKDKSKRKVAEKVLETVRQTIAAHRMLATGDCVLVAVSGGADSVTLAHVLHTLSAEYALRLAVAHLDHGLRRQASERDAEFVADFARRLNVPFYLGKRDVRRFQQCAHLSLEEAGRRMRYKFFEEIAASNCFNKIATGHHSNDNAELVLMNLLRGSGPLGLSGIIPVRDGKIIRPLIQLKRSEIADYVAEKKLSFVTDASNADWSYRRNRIRHHLIPELEKSYNPGIVDTLNRLGTILRAEDQWCEDLLRKDFDECIAAKGPGTIRLNPGRLEGLATAAKRRIVRRAIRSVKNDLRRVTLLHIDAVVGLIDKHPKGGYLNLPDGIRVALTAADLTISDTVRLAAAGAERPAAPVVGDYQYAVAGPGILSIQEAGAAIKFDEIDAGDLPDFNDVHRSRAFFDMDCLQFPLVVRNFRPGDRFSPLGVRGSQKVKKYFIDNKIPAHLRRTCPLLLSGGKIIWIAGHRIDNCAKVVPATQRVLKAELLLA